jgi:hypothetical protein
MVDPALRQGDSLRDRPAETYQHSLGYVHLDDRMFVYR